MLPKGGYGCECEHTKSSNACFVELKHTIIGLVTLLDAIDQSIDLRSERPSSSLSLALIMMSMLEII